MRLGYSIALKQKLAHWLQTVPSLRWGLAVAVRWLVPRQHVGAVGAIFNEQGQVLLVKHVFRPQYPWGLPGGWLERGEDPGRAVQRECAEELGLQIQVKQLLVCQPQGHSTGVPPGLGLAYYCRLADESGDDQSRPAPQTYELLAVEWVDPGSIAYPLTPLEDQAIALGRRLFEQDQITKNGA